MTRIADAHSPILSVCLMLALATGGLALGEAAAARKAERRDGPSWNLGKSSSGSSAKKHGKGRHEATKAKRGAARRFAIETLSAPADQVTGGDVLVRIRAPRQRRLRRIRVFQEDSYLSIDYRNESEGFLYDVATGGFALGAEFTF